MNKVLIVGTGLGGLATALRLAHRGFQVEMLEQYHQAGGRLNQIVKDGFTFDMGPSFFSMSYEFEELFHDIGIKNPLQFHELDPLYAVYFANSSKEYLIHKDLKKLGSQFPNEKDFELKAKKYLEDAKSIFHDTEYRIVKRNYKTIFDYAAALISVPLKHAPKLLRTMWTELSRNFETEEVKIIFSLVAFFLGATPFDTPAVYSLLNYTELQHDGYWNIKGGMYKITETIVQLLKQKGVKIHYNVKIVSARYEKKHLSALIDQNGHAHEADLFVCNADAAFFRGEVLQREKYSEVKLDKMDWTLAPFTIYLGVKGKLDHLYHHNYFLGDNFYEYANKIFKTSVSPQKPYYYLNILSKHNPNCAPEGCESLFILCPVPDKRYKPDWSDTDALTDTILSDLSKRTGFDLKANMLTIEVMNPSHWEKAFSLYKGSGLGLAHGLNQVGGLRPSNKDEQLSNLYYVGASTVPGTGLPIVVVGSRLVTERIMNEWVPANSSN